MNTRFVTIVAACLALAACATSGRKIDASQLTDLKVGQTTVADVEGKFGPPTQTSSDSTGFTTLSYVYTHAEADAKSFIPIADAFVGGANTESQSVSFIFGTNGKLKSYSRSSGQNAIGTGLSSGQAQ